MADSGIKVRAELAKNNISYIMIDPQLTKTQNYSVDYWEKNFELIYSSENYKIYDIQLPKQNSKRHI